MLGICFRKKKSGRKKKSSRIALEENNENVENATFISYEICLEPNITYKFSIYDSFGDGMCCLEGPGEYLVLVDNKVIKRGGEFNVSDIFMFHILDHCLTNTDCDDDDSSTIDKCLSEASTCLNEPQKECNDYGQMIYVNVTIGEIYNDDIYDYYSEDNDIYYELIDENGKMKLKGGPFTAAYTTFHSSTCLADGTYAFTIFGGGYGLSGSWGGDGNYIVYTEENTKLNYIASGSYFDYNETTTFTFNKASLMPSTLPSSVGPTISNAPSITNFPSTYPTSTKYPSLSAYPSLSPSASLDPTKSSNPSSCGSIVSVITYQTDIKNIPFMFWEIRDNNGKKLHSHAVTAMSETTEICLSRGVYVFNIYDVEGNGFEYYYDDDWYDDGYYVIDIDGYVVKRGSEFGHIETTTLIIPTIMMPSMTPSSSQMPSPPIPSKKPEKFKKKDKKYKKGKKNKKDKKYKKGKKDKKKKSKKKSEKKGKKKKPKGKVVRKKRTRKVTKRRKRNTKSKN